MNARTARSSGYAATKQRSSMNCTTTSGATKNARNVMGNIPAEQNVARKGEPEIQALADKVCKHMEKTGKGLCTDDWVELCELVEHQARNYIEAAAQDESDE
jgi:hypothetical protein